MYQKKSNLKKYNKIKIRADGLHNSLWFAKMINKFMRHGKKHTVEKSVWEAFENVKKITKIRAHMLLFFTLIRVRPKFGFISKRFGKEYKKIPVPLYPRRQIITALQWFIIVCKLNNMLYLKARVRFELWNFLVNKSGLLIQHYKLYKLQLHENRLNYRFRWK